MWNDCHALGVGLGAWHCGVWTNPQSCSFLEPRSKHIAWWKICGLLAYISQSTFRMKGAFVITPETLVCLSWNNQGKRRNISNYTTIQGASLPEHSRHRLCNGVDAWHASLWIHKLIRCGSPSGRLSLFSNITYKVTIHGYRISPLPSSLMLTK